MEPWCKMNWGLRNSMLVVDPGQQLNSGQVLGELGRITDGLSGKFGRGRDSSDLFWEEESSSKFSGSCDSPLIDLKLGNIHNSGFSEETMILSSSESIAPPKKVRAVVVSNQVAYCQVYGCNKDLSSSKDYHKRHKVCEVHSKTARVIVNGIEQRFCQQCSRFHLLAEFDNGKRSCRKRLAGHNERRRKPQVSFHPGRAGRFLQPYSDGKLQGNTFSTSFICRDILPGNGLLHPEKDGRNDCHGQIKFEEKTNCDPMSINFFQYQQLQSSSSFPCMFEKELSPYHINSTSSTSPDMFTNIGRYQQEREGLNSDFAIFDTASAIEGFCGISESGCALSLLSSQSQNSSSHTSGIPMDQSLITTGTQSQHSITQDSENLRTGVSDRIIQGSDFLNAKDHCLDQPEDGATINLFQLSSQLQRVEHERQFVHMSPESDAFFCLRTT